MEKQKANNEKAGSLEETLPLGVILDRAREDVGTMLFNYMGRNGIPPSLFDFVLADVVSKVKEMKASEYAGKFADRMDERHDRANAQEPDVNEAKEIQKEGQAGM